MHYSKDYSKLKKNEYATIRRYPKGKLEDVKRESYPSGSHFAKITNIERKPLVQISTPFLLEDTDCETREEAVDLIGSFYQKPINYYKERLYIYYLKKVKY